MLTQRAGTLIGAAVLFAAGLALGAALRLPLAAWDGLLSSDSAVDSAAKILAEPDPFARSIDWGAMLERADRNAVEPLREAIAASPLDVSDLEVISFAMWWARFDPQAALAWTTAEWRAQSEFVIGQIFRIWAQSDPEAAFKAIAGVAQQSQDAAIDAVVTGWYGSGRPGLVEFVQTLPADVMRQRVAESLARHLVITRGVEAATRWVESLQSPAFQQVMSVRVASSAAFQGDAAAVAAWATPQVSSGREHISGFPRRIGTRWVLRDPPAALAWLASLPAGNDRDDGVAESFRDWLRVEPGAALEWIQNAKLEPWSEAAFGIYALWMARSDPAAALELATRFSDPDRRNRTITVIARAWAAQDPEAAQAWLARADLPPDVRKRASMKLRERKPAGPADDLDAAGRDPD